jgi:hypothetical protein
MTRPGNEFNSPSVSSFSRRSSSPATPSAFTLIEVTISVALAVVLMLGISEVFKVVGETVGTGNALADTQRQARSAQAVMAGDFNTVVTDGAPYMLMDSGQVFAFQNQADMLGDKDGDPSTYDLRGTGSESGQPAVIYNYRSHRKDDFTFFGRGSFARQTGADVYSLGTSPFVSNMGANEAMLWYGLVNIADNSGNFPPNGMANGVTPGAAPLATNPNNYFATSWILGRQQILLVPPTPLDNNNNPLTPPKVIDKNGVEQYAYTQQASIPLSPLAVGSQALSSAGGSLPLASQGSTAATLLSGRIDLAATSIAGYRNILLADIAKPDPTWYQNLPGGSGSGITSRFRAQPFFLAKPPTPESISYQAPIFVRGCTQFIVEYAGDYLNQDPNTGVVTDTYAHVAGTAPNFTISPGTTDGQIDFIQTGTAPNISRKIRWYGFPRSTTNSTTINYTNGDVVPLRDLWVTATNGSQGPNAPFERASTFLTAGAQPDYAQIGAIPTNSQYTCAWGPSDVKPKMIRITITIDDPGGRLGDGQTFEYIYTLP